jgi:putative DNA primase/helicase
MGGIQPARLRTYLADALRDGPANDGLIQRFQVLIYPDPPARWRYVDRLPNFTATQTAEKVYRRLIQMDASQPVRLRFAPDAQELFTEWLYELETKCLRNSELHPALVSHFAKYRKLVPVLALLFELADNAEAESVSLEHSQQSAAFCEYLQSHARRIYSMSVSPEKRAAINLAHHLSNGWRHETGIFSIRDVERNAWSGLTEPEDARKATSMLERAGWIRREKGNQGIGRPSEVYRINPKIKRRTK